MEYYSAIKRNTFKSVLMRWINLEPIIQSEVKLEREKQIYIDAYIWNLERCTDEPIGRATMETQT